MHTFSLNVAHQKPKYSIKRKNKEAGQLRKNSKKKKSQRPLTRKD